MQKLIAIIGPTSSGKSDLAVYLAKKFKGEVISADSRQVYKGMNLGTGKITRNEMKGVIHHLLDVTSPKKRFTVALYKKKADRVIEDIIKRRRLPILCGGTGFYIEAVVDNILIPEVPPDLELRKELEQRTNFELFLMLKKLDKKRAEGIDRFNKRRLVRSLEIILKTKKKIPPLKKKGFPYPVLLIGIKKEKEELEQRIKERLWQRLKKGMVSEVEKLHESGVSFKRLEEFGLEYRWISLYLQKTISYNEMVKRLEKDIVNFSKRQMTWFKKDKRVQWVKSKEEAENLVNNFL